MDVVATEGGFESSTLAGYPKNVGVLLPLAPHPSLPTWIIRHSAPDDTGNPHGVPPKPASPAPLGAIYGRVARATKIAAVCVPQGRTAYRGSGSSSSRRFVVERRKRRTGTKARTRRLASSF